MMAKVIADFKLQIELRHSASDEIKIENEREIGLQCDID